jgi:hypothetical protein
MASGLGIDYAADHEEQERDREAVIKLRGRTIPAVVGIPANGRDFESDATGYYDTKGLRVTVRDAVVPSYGAQPLDEGETLEYDGAVYLVQSLVHDSKSAISVCECEAEAQ